MDSREKLLLIILLLLVIHFLFSTLKMIYRRFIDKPKSCHNCKSKDFRFNYSLSGTVFTTHFWICNKCGHETRVRYKDWYHKDYEDTPDRVESKTDSIYKVKE